MKAILAAKRKALDAGKSPSSSAIDIVGHLVRAQEEMSAEKTPPFSDTDVMGNLFVLFIAGHETSASSIHFSLLLLAMNPRIQKAVQEDLDTIFSGRPCSTWDYERDLPRLLSSMLGAVLSEQLRLVAPVVNIPKMTGAAPQTLVVDGRPVVIPARTMVRLCIPALHRNPNFWPCGPPRDPEWPAFGLGIGDNDLEEFKPERWLRGMVGAVKEKENGHGNDSGRGSGSENGNAAFKRTTSHDAAEASPPQKAPSTHPTRRLSTPVKGSYIPFSDGQRACIGRRFAQAEILASLAVILSSYSIELAVDEQASDAQVAAMTANQKQEVWKVAEERAQWVWQNKMSCGLSLLIRASYNRKLGVLIAK